MEELKVEQQGGGELEFVELSVVEPKRVIQ